MFRKNTNYVLRLGMDPGRTTNRHNGALRITAPQPTFPVLVQEHRAKDNKPQFARTTMCSLTKKTRGMRLLTKKPDSNMLIKKNPSLESCSPKLNLSAPNPFPSLLAPSNKLFFFRPHTEMSEMTLNYIPACQKFSGGSETTLKHSVV